MLYGRSLGESFGLACAEFSNQGKKLITYKFNRHKSHINKLPKNNYEEYSSRKSLFNILSNYKKNKSNKLFTNNKYLSYTPKKVMKTFNKVFLKTHIHLQARTLRSARHGRASQCTGVCNH